MKRWALGSALLLALLWLAWSTFQRRSGEPRQAEVAPPTAAPTAVAETRKPTPNAAPLKVAKTADEKNPTKTTPASEPSEADKTAWNEFRQILARLPRLGQGSQTDLDHLYQALGRKIADNPDAFSRFYRSRMGNLQNTELRQSLFLTKALVQSHPNAAPVIANLLETPQDSVKTTDGHLSPSPKVNMVKAFAMNEWVKAHEGQPVDPQDRRELESRATRLAKEDPDLSVVRASLKVISTVAENPETAVRKAVAGRRPDEAFAYSDLVPPETK